MKVENVSQKKLMQCVLCSELYSEYDVIQLRFFPDTGVCFDCYEDMKEQKYENYCFGKGTLTTAIGNGRQALALGYEPGNENCDHLCPDRKYCPLFLSGKIYKLQKAIQTVPVQVKVEPVKKEKVVAQPAPLPRVGDNPYKPSSRIFSVFELLKRPGGTTKDELDSLLGKLGLAYATTRRMLLWGGEGNLSCGMRWTLEKVGSKERIVIRK